MRRFVRDAAEKIARQTANAPQESKNVHEWMEAEILAEAQRQLDKGIPEAVLPLTMETPARLSAEMVAGNDECPSRRGRGRKFTKLFSRLTYAHLGRII